jgi:glycosyltransferase 2 family protein
MGFFKRDAKGWLRFAGNALGVILTFGSLWWFLRGLSPRALGATFEQAMPAPLLAALLLNFAGQFVRTAAWRVMLAPDHRVPFRRLLYYEYAAQSASSTSPAKAGEVLRFWLLKRDGVPAVTTGGLIALKKLIGANALTLLVIASPWLLPGLPGWVAPVVLVFGACMVGLLALLCLIANRATTRQLPKFLVIMIGGLDLLRDGSRTLAASGVILIGEAIDLFAAWVVMSALHLHEPLAAAGLTLFLIDVSNAIPAAPAQLGTFEVGAYYALDLLHVPQSAAIAFAILFHAQQTLPQIVVGLPFELHFLVGRRRESAEAGPPEPAVGAGA